jgi:hypothetical protein
MGLYVILKCKKFKSGFANFCGSLTTDSHIASRVHDVPLPMQCRWGFRMCLSHLIYTVRPCLIHTIHATPMPCSDHPFFSRSRHSTAVDRRPVGSLPAFGFFRLTRGIPRSYQKHNNLRCRWPVWNQTPFVMDEEKSGSSTLQKDDLLHCWTSSSDISGDHADFHEGPVTVGAWQGRGMSCVS